MERTPSDSVGANLRSVKVVRPIYPSHRCTRSAGASIGIYRRVLQCEHKFSVTLLTSLLWVTLFELWHLPGQFLVVFQFVPFCGVFGGFWSLQDFSCFGVNVHRVSLTVCSVRVYLEKQVPGSLK